MKKTNNNENLIKAIATYAVVNEKTGRQICTATAQNAADGLGLNITVDGKYFFVDGEKICRVEAVGRLIGTCALKPTNVGHEREKAEKNAKKRDKRTPEQIEAENERVATNFFVKLHHAKIEAEKIEAEKNKARDLLADEITEKDNKVAELEAKIAALEAAQNKPATKKATTKKSKKTA